MAEEVLPGSGRRRLSFGLYGREHHYYGAPAAVALAESAVKAAPSRESARRALIEAHLAQGNIAAAVRQTDDLPTYGHPSATRWRRRMHDDRRMLGHASSVRRAPRSRTSAAAGGVNP